MTEFYLDPEEIINPRDIDHALIHPTAMVARGAELAHDVQVGPGAIIGPHVVLGPRVQVGASAIVRGRTRIGADTKIYPFATIGSIPQDLKYRGEDSMLIIGERNKIREYVNISLGTEGGGNKTQIGHDNLFMVYCHIGHDAIIGNECIFANGTAIAGHVIIGNRVVFGGLSAAHQFCRFGDLAMVAAGGMAAQDVPPFCMVHGNRAKINGLNVVGIRRSSYKNLQAIKSMYRILYNENLTLDEAMKRIELEIEPCPEKDVFLDFLRKSERGICR